MINPQVTTTSKHFGLPPALVQAVMDAEGGPDALIKAVNCSVKVTTLEEAIFVVCRSITHRFVDYIIKNGQLKSATDYLATFWAPVDADNDPTDLNKNWPKNVLSRYEAHK